MDETTKTALELLTEIAYLLVDMKYESSISRYQELYYGHHLKADDFEARFLDAQNDRSRREEQIENIISGLEES